ncbi:stage II sporulation protein M [Garciella nitratireducens]|uniref:Uncharacterized membrane protein SpoIIM, required for sporulation n=1 Tax=Garciella nitratireducens DSM 15102 TaxID=1121911 RepID=A0A1T4KD96_9FIRM|nr:stage II sporulation protein M [Garciella nitratireducens]SJZ40303.1 Uncharacterized membrane protein SpoIIM, required for sporulation [Garciella nitratireducens DSM 15102]
MKLNFRYIKIASLIFLIFFIIGFIGTYIYCNRIEFDNAIGDQLVINKIYFSEIIIRNLTVCVIAILGIITFKISSILVLIINAVILSFILSANYVTTGELWYFIRIVIPHAIFEIPAIVISSSIGFEGFSYFKDYSFKEKISNLFLIIGLLIVAAFVEVNISTLFV